MHTNTRYVRQSTWLLGLQTCSMAGAHHSPATCGVKALRHADAWPQSSAHDMPAHRQARWRAAMRQSKQQAVNCAKVPVHHSNVTQHNEMKARPVTVPQQVNGGRSRLCSGAKAMPGRQEEG
jgi:hypothetical protein